MSRPRSANRLRGAVAVAAGLALIVGCSSNSGLGSSTSTSPTSSSPAASSSAPAAGTLTVFAAASLKLTFTEIGTLFQQQNPGTTVAFNFAGSADLVTQLTGGAPADVLATADTTNMTKATTAKLVSGTPVNFASNILTIIVGPGNPSGIKSFADLAKPGLDVVVCAPQVPCGAATAKVEANTAVTLKPVSEESSVTDVLGKVATGQADAGLVYVTDAKGAGSKVAEVDFPEAAAVVNAYPIAALTAATQPELATKFIALVTGADGQKILAEAGFKAAP